MKLYEISEELYQLYDMMENEEDAELLQDSLDSVLGQADVKLENMAKIIKNLQADVDMLKAEEQRLSSRRKTLENNISWLKYSIMNFMQVHGIDKVKGDVLNISIAKNGGKLPVIIDVDVETLPDDVCKIEKKADNTKIAELIDAGKCDFAHYGERGTHLNIK